LEATREAAGAWGRTEGLGKGSYALVGLAITLYHSIELSIKYIVGRIRPPLLAAGISRCLVVYLRELGSSNSLLFFLVPEPSIYLYGICSANGNAWNPWKIEAYDA
jgi:hypothetical protein